MPLLTAATGGFIEGDAGEVLPTAWMIAHGDFGCAYPNSFAPASSAQTLPMIPVLAAPLYPLIASGYLALLSPRPAPAFPSARAAGPGCARSYALVSRWMSDAGVYLSTLWSASLAWIALAGAMWMALKESRHRRSRALALFVAALALGPPLYEAFAAYYHPQDLLAIALAVLAARRAGRRQWVAAGVLCALGLLTQQFDLFVALPLLVASLRLRDTRFLTGLVATYVAIAVPLLVLSHGTVLRALVLGSDRLTPSHHAIHSSGGTWLAGLHPAPIVAFVVARILPVVLSAALSVWAARRLGADIIQPQYLMPVIGISFALRLLFEMNMFGYYFAAVYVFALLSLAFARLNARAMAVGLGLFMIGFDPLVFTSKFMGITVTTSYLRLPGLAVLAVLVALSLLRLRERNVVVAEWVCLAAALVATWPLLGESVPALRPIPYWILQLVLGALVLVMLAAPLRARALGSSESTAPDLGPDS